MSAVPKSARRLYDTLGPEAFSRQDEDDDALFYEKPRTAPQLDRVALDTVERVIGTLVTEDRPVVLDLMSSCDSHLPKSLIPSQLVGLGLNAAELEQNPALDERVIHDLNQEPTLPFEDARFDVVLITVSVEYLTKPLEVFAEVARVLKPGGLNLVIFSNRMFPPKAVQIWRDGSERERLWLVEDYFEHLGEVFEKPRIFTSQGKLRPPDDPFADRGIPSDPVIAVYADKLGRSADRAARPEVASEHGDPIEPEELASRKKGVAETLECPYCQEPFTKIELEETPFMEWDIGFVYVCMNDRCSYYVTSFEEMAAQGNMGYSCRLLYDPVRDRLQPTADVKGPVDVQSRLAPRG